mmetsp:Transcript_13541/g.15218  ORF Transcript_13541/g.15218 Transcript_13541/m.15218 type:complete len:375 (-) Transcript_13541:26-1150(-)
MNYIIFLWLVGQRTAECFNLAKPSNLLINRPTQSLAKSGPLYAGGFGGGGSKAKGKKTSSSKDGSISTKKKIQMKEKLLKSYGGDIAKGTEKRIQDAFTSLPPHIQPITELYRKVSRWDAYVASLSLIEESKISLSDIDGAKRARLELESLYEQHNIDEKSMHNLFQKITWDASADAKATNAIIGEMPQHIATRIDKACGILGEVVKKAGRKGRCLDVGCGPGTLIPSLTKVGIYPGQITGVDLSTEMIRNAQERYRGPTFVATDFLQFAANECFDGILFCSALHDLPDMTACLRKAADLLLPDGKIVIVHAQGAAHVMNQHKTNPVLVKRFLPDGDELTELASELHLKLDNIPAKAASKEDAEDGYLAVLTKL